jgi:hypothetical protein
VLAAPAVAMASFPINPLAFLPEGLTIDHGPADRKVRTDLVVSPNAPLHNDKVVIAETNRFIPIHLRQSMRDDVKALLDEAGYTISAFDDHPFGLGSYTFVHTLSADTAIGLSFEIDEITSVTFVKHNEAKNMRLTSFGRSIWLLLLGFPLDYQTTSYISSAVEDFGLLVVWDNPRGNNKFVLVKVHIVHPKFVPKTLVMHELGGNRHSWSVPIVMLRSSDWNAHIHDIPPPPEDPYSDDPHPLFGNDYTAEELFQQQVANWLQLNQQQGGHGNQQQGQHQHQLLLQPAEFQNNQPIQIQPAEVGDVPEAEIHPPNLNAQTVVQGVPFHAGFHPSGAILADSPMQAYHDYVSDTDSDIMVQTVFVHNSLYAANADALNSLARNSLHYYCSPQLELDNAYFFESIVKFDASVMFELFGERFLFLQNKKRAVKTLMSHPIDMGNLDASEETDQNLSSSDMFTDIFDETPLTASAGVAIAGKKRKKTVAKIADPPTCTAQVRRSSRCNKYDGFKPKNVSDTKPFKSKVKPRKGTSALNLCQIEENSDDIILAQGTPPPAHTPIPVMQSIGINLCGVPPEDISPKKLLASVQETEDEEEDKA